MRYLLRGVNSETSGLRDLNEDCLYTSFIPIKGSPTEMMSLIAGRGDLGPLMSLTPYQMSFLVPSVRLYKTYVSEAVPGMDTPPDAGKSWDVELMFADNIAGTIQTDVTSATTVEVDKPRLKQLLEDRIGRGTGVGITGFSWKYEGTNPAEAANLLTANLSLHFNEIGELFQKRGPVEVEYLDGSGTRKNCYYQFIDLIMRTALTGGPGNANIGMANLPAMTSNACRWQWLYDPEYFELKAVIGWEFTEESPFSEDQLAALRACSTILYLTIVDHVINYSEDGSVSLDISYRAAIEGVLDDPNCDLLRSTFERARQAQVEAITTALRTGEDQVVTGDGRVQAAGDAYGNPGQGAAAGNAATSSYENQIDVMENHLADLRRLSRSMGSEIFLRWLSDETHHSEINVPGGSAYNGRKLEKDDKNSYYDSVSENSENDHYGYPWFLSYGPNHGAKQNTTAGRSGGQTWDGDNEGVPRIKVLDIPFTLIESAGETRGSSTIQSAVPPWYTTNSGPPSSAISGFDEGGYNEAVGKDGSNPSIMDKMSDEIAEEASAAASENAGTNDSGEIGGTWNDLVSDAVDRAILFGGQHVPPGDQDHYRIRFVYFGDILDWAIRKALHRPPYHPDSMRINLESVIDGITSAGVTPSTRAEFSDWTAAADSGGQIDELDAWFDEANSEERLFGSNDATGANRDLGPQQVRDYLNDLKKRKYDKINIILGDVEFWDPYQNKIRSVNLADLPLSLARLNEWWVNSVLKRGQYTMGIRRFINKILNELVFDTMAGNRCYSGEPNALGSYHFTEQIFDVGITNFTLPAYGVDADDAPISPAEFITKRVHYDDRNADGSPRDANKPNYRIPIGKLRAALTADQKRSMYTISTEETTEVYHFIAIYARGYENGTLLGFETSTEATEALPYLRSQGNSQFDAVEELPGDIDRGIVHFYLGQNQGMLKSIRFTRTDQQYLAESRLFGMGAFGYNQLRGRYDATITMTGNNFFLPGQIIYINPASVGTSASSEYGDLPLFLGLGGYYMIVHIDSTMTPEFFETVLTCTWVGKGDLTQCKDNQHSAAGLNSEGTIITLDDALAFVDSLPGSGT
ncbi:MAG TPA: hypothetical protein DEQ32_13530 [Gammaproteobacteria bacterium]|nr:hypothetical protein [Gammaproteobacteria bacterium]